MCGMNSKKLFNRRKARRVKRTRAKIFGTGKIPRLAVSRSNRFIYAQLIDDGKGRTLAHASSMELKDKKAKSAKAALVGELIGKRAKDLGIKAVVFDRREYKYHGRIKALADGARRAGLKF